MLPWENATKVLWGYRAAAMYVFQTNPVGVELLFGRRPNRVIVIDCFDSKLQY